MRASGKAAIKDHWKIVRLKGKPWELYHLAEDPCELNDLAAKRPKKVEALQTLYDAWAAEDNKGKAIRGELANSRTKEKGA